MPQKTRKEKIAAQKRRTSVAYTIKETPDISTQKEQETQEKNIFDLTSKNSKEETTIARYFTQDLRKSLLLSAFILALEILLRFVRIG